MLDETEAAPRAKRMARTWRRRAGQLKTETYALYLAARDPRMPWYGKALALCVLAYAASPIDLIPDFIPVLGYLDDLILLPLGIALVIRTIPPEVMAESRGKARDALRGDRPVNWVAAGVIAAAWVLAALLAGLFVWRMLGR